MHRKDNESFETCRNGSQHYAHSSHKHRMHIVKFFVQRGRSWFCASTGEITKASRPVVTGHCTTFSPVKSIVCITAIFKGGAFSFLCSENLVGSVHARKDMESFETRSNRALNYVNSCHKHRMHTVVFRKFMPFPERTFIDIFVCVCVCVHKGESVAPPSPHRLLALTLGIIFKWLPSAPEDFFGSTSLI